MRERALANVGDDFGIAMQVARAASKSWPTLGFMVGPPLTTAAQPASKNNRASPGPGATATTATLVLT